MASYRVISHQIPASYIREYSHATAHSEEDVLQLAVKQYIPVDNPNPRPGDVTIIAAHANGFPKELYEPLWEDLIKRAQEQGWNIRGIWMADVAWQGESGVINEGMLGNDPGWNDHARDIMHLINIKRKDMPKPLIGIGHSMGGAQLAKVALDHPNLFTTLVMLDPVIQKVTAEIKPLARNTNIAYMSTFRRPIWPSREEARVLFSKSGFYQQWDPRCLALWVKYGLRDCPNPQFPDAKAPQVSLRTTVSQEVQTFLRPMYDSSGVVPNSINRTTHPDLDPSMSFAFPFYRGEAPMLYQKLPELRPSCLYLFGGTSNTSRPELNEDKVKRTGSGIGGSGGVAAGRVKAFTFPGIGHLVPMETPEGTANHIATWVGGEVALFKDHLDRWNKEWKSKTLREKQDIGDAWKKAMGGPPQKTTSKI